MVKLAAALSSVINGGSYYEPHVVKQILNDQGAVVKKVEPNLVRETVSQATSDFVRNAMFLTVDSEEVVPYDDGLGLPDTVAGGGQTPGGAASETLSETPPAPGPENAPEGQGETEPQ